MTKKTLQARNGKTNAGFDLVQHALSFQGKEKITGLTDAQTRAYASAVMRKESAGKVNSDNQRGYYGQYQFGAEALVETGLIDREKYNAAIASVKKKYGENWRKQWYAKDAGLHAKFLEDESNWKISGGLTRYLDDKALQDAKFVEFTNKQIQQGIKLKAIGADASAERIAAFAGAAHLKGVGGANALFKHHRETRDGNGTSTAEYAQIAQQSINDLAPQVARAMQDGPSSAQSVPAAPPPASSAPASRAALAAKTHDPAGDARPAAATTTASAALPKHPRPALDGQAILNQRRRFDGYKYRYGGNGQQDAKGVRRIDCSHLVNQALTGAGYAIPYQTTTEMGGSKYYEEIAPKDVKPGDIALWRGDKNHTGIVEAYDAKTGKGDFFGAQNKKGASSAKLGKGSWWGQPQKFLRPKAEYLQSPPGTNRAEAAGQAPAPAQAMASGDTVRKLLKTEGATRVYQMADGTVQTREGGTVAWRNNNPGNLKFGYAGSRDKTDHSKRNKARALADARKRYQGVVDLDQWGNAIFANEAAGRAAKAQLLSKRHGGKTIEQMLPKYAVSDYSGKADHARYAAGIHKLAASRGLDLRGKKIQDLNPAEFEALLDGMKKVEGFKAGKTSVSRPAAAEPAAPPPGDPAPSPTVPAAKKPVAQTRLPAAAPAGQAKAKPKQTAAGEESAGRGGEATLAALIGQLGAALAQLNSQLAQPIQIRVDVQNGNIVAAVNAANSQQHRRN